MSNGIMCTALRQYPAARADRVVLVGCVLASEWDWVELLRLKRNAFKEIRNEWTNSDWVVQFARWVPIQGFGPAGGLRFTGAQDLIHDVAHPTLACTSCETVTARIHNVDCSGLGHNDVFLGPAHAELFWLPYLWGIDPAEYMILLDLCKAASEQNDLGNRLGLREAEDELLEHHWQWTGNPLLSFRQYIEEYVRQNPRHIGKSMDELVRLIVYAFWRRVEDAHKTRRVGTNPNKDVVLCLHPVRALFYAVDLTLSSP